MFFLNATGDLEVAEFTTTADAFERGRVTTLFSAAAFSGAIDDRFYDVALDDQRFLMARPTGSEDLYDDILKLSAGKRCLLVEDNVINQKVTSAILRKLGYDVDVAENGSRAVDMVNQYSYTVILMDCQMPIMDGYRATRELRLRNVTTPIIGVTANAMEDDRDKCLKAGMDDYLPKPVKIASMKALLQHWDN